MIEPKDAIDRDYRPVSVVTERTLEHVRQNATRISGSVRAGRGRVLTTARRESCRREAECDARNRVQKENTNE